VGPARATRGGASLGKGGERERERARKRERARERETELAGQGPLASSPRCTMSPSPSCPCVLSPQHLTVASSCGEKHVRVTDWLRIAGCDGSFTGGASGELVLQVARANTGLVKSPDAGLVKAWLDSCLTGLQP